MTFTILSGGNPVGGTVSASVVNGVASTNDNLVAGTAGGTYTIQAVYTDPVDFVTSTGNNVLIVTAAATTTTTTGTSTSYNDSAGEPVTLTANVSSAAGTVDEGAVAFTILNAGNSVVGSVSASVVNGVASINDDLAAGTAGGTLHDPGGLHRSVRLRHVHRDQRFERGCRGDHDHDHGDVDIV